MTHSDDDYRLAAAALAADAAVNGPDVATAGWYVRYEPGRACWVWTDADDFSIVYTASGTGAAVAVPQHVVALALGDVPSVPTSTAFVTNPPPGYGPPPGTPA